MLPWYLEGYFSGDGLIHRQTIQETPFVMGREENLGLTVFAGSISRRHASISVNGSVITIEDLGSKNGTKVNGERLETPNERVELTNGDELRFGNVRALLCDAAALWTAMVASS